MNIVISPYSAKLRNGKPNPKNYPWFPELVARLVAQHHRVTQIGVSGEERIAGVDHFVVDAPFVEIEIKLLLLRSDLWIAVDNWLGHFVNCDVHQKPGVVLWGQSDPRIFGYEYNLNLLKGRQYLRYFQFDSWEAADYNESVFVSPKEVMDAIAVRFTSFIPVVPTSYDARIDM
jgi:hypothetical protein